jgi:hypothetical protein
LIRAISDLVRETVDSKFRDLERDIPTKVEESVGKTIVDISGAVTKAHEYVRQIEKARTEVTEIVAEIENKLTQSNTLYGQMEAIRPAYELWKSVGS